MSVIGEIIDCGDEGDGNGDSETGQSGTITGESGNKVSLDGSWNGICDSDEEDGTSDKQILTIVGSSFTVNVSHWYESTTCSGTADVFQVISGSFTLGDEVTVTLNSSNVTATELDIVISASQATVFDPGVLAELNADQECGYNDWVVGVPKNLMGTSCISGTNQKDVIYIDDTASPDVWYSGEEEGPFDENGYPVVIDLESEAERM